MKIHKVGMLISSILIIFSSFVYCSNVRGNDLNIIKDYKKQGWQVTDSIDVAFVNDEIYGVAVVMVDNGKAKQHRRLLVFIEGDNSYSLLCNNCSIFGGPNWGIQGNDAFSSIYLSPEGLVLSFNTGAIHRELQSYYFDLANNKLTLVKYLVSEYNIMDIDEDGTLILETIEDYDLINNIHSSYKLSNEERSNVKENRISHREIYIDDINAENGIWF